ncbi:MAG: hypothetical protein II075_01945 [Bacteroidales bacterium]|nr:hypothetical protein [Bacteroidales bacterium]
MKRRFFRASWMLALAGLVAFSFVGTSCGDDDKEDEKVQPTPNPDPTPTPTPDPDPTPTPDPDPTPTPDPTPVAKNHVIVVKASDMVDHEWDTQFWFYSPTKFVEGDSWEVSIDVKADKSTAADVANGISTQTHKDNAGGYIHWAAIGGVTFTEEWVTYTANGTFTAEQVDGDYVAFNLNDFNPANNYYFDNISFKVNGTEQIKNGDIEGTDFSSFFIKEYPATDAVAVAAANVIEMDGGSSVTPAPTPTPDPEPTPTPTPTPEPTDGTVDLTADGFSTWSDWVNGEITGAADCALVLNEPTGQPYGDPGVNNYIDLSGYKTLVVTVSDGAPRFLLNRDEPEGQNPDHLINIPNDEGQTAAYQTSVDNGDGTTTYTIDLAKIVADKGYAHLHAIKGANWADVTVVSMKLTK